MARGKGRGGYQAPASPAPVSGPGGLSARTDGGPAQPMRVPTGGAYGQASDLAAMQRAAPLPQATAPRPGPSRGGPAAGGVPDPFRPTERPGEPVTAGIPMGPGPMGPGSLVPEDPDMLIRAFAANLYAQGLDGAASKLLRLMRTVR